VPEQFVEIIILAVVAAFLGMRLYSVLGQRAEHEEESIPRPRDPALRPDQVEPDQSADRAGERTGAPQNAHQFQAIPDIVPAVERGVREIAAADRRFEILGFLEGAKGAYGMVLEAFWNGDRETLKELCDDDVYESFDGAIAIREEAGEKLDNRLIRIEEAVIDSATLDGSMSRIAVRFVADIAAVTYDKDGTMIAGSLDDAIESRDIWTFMRDVHSTDPNWLLDETDEG